MWYTLIVNDFEILQSQDLVKIYEQLDLILENDFKTSFSTIEDQIRKSPNSANCKYKCDKFEFEIIENENELPQRSFPLDW